MTFNQLRYFYAVCEEESISQAAEKLHVAQPTVSIAMQSLEKETGINLFQRDKNKISLTSEAYLLLSKVKDVVERLNKLEDTIKDMAQGHSHIRLALPVQLSITFLPAIMGDFCVQHPEIELEILEMGGVSVLNMVEEGQLDMAFTNFSGQVSDRLTYQRLFDCECFFCTWPDHPLAKKKTVTIEEVAAEPMVMLDSHFVIYHAAHDNFSRHDCSPNVIHYTPYLHTAKNLVRQHIASTILIRYSVLPEEEQVVLIPFAEPFYFKSGIVFKKGRQIYAHERVLMDYLQDITRQAKKLK